MKNIIFVISMVIGLCGTSFGMLTHQQRQQLREHRVTVSYINDGGQQVVLPMFDDGHDIPAWLQAALQDFFQNIIAQHSMSDHATSPLPTAVAPPVSDYILEIGDLERLFCGGNISIDKLRGYYRQLEERLDREDFISGLDESLRVINEKAADSGVYLPLAQRYKDKAMSDGASRGDCIKAAFWFRMLHATEAHDYYHLDWYNRMISEYRNFHCE
ncbi:MAG: hypothetical protein ACD_21C00267G0009 [uncultured bacterium]|nr:MAG: hypothetical protein ACD_21C00267G0009 [uncultured bacterium]